jgi:hypothetical protein
MTSIRLAILTIILLVTIIHTGFAQEAKSLNQVWDTYSDCWTATDSIGRPVADHAITGDVRPEKVVALFYYIWHGQHTTRLYDIAKTLKQNPDDPPWGPVHAFHHWSEPLYGYYRADDEYVVRKNAQMLADAGVDAIFFDVTNALPYTKIYMNLCRIYSDIRKQGGRTPQIAFLTNSSSGKTVQSIYNDLYAKGLYQDLWFYWKGKPIILAKSEEMTEEQREFFTVRRSWAWQPGKDQWPWLEHYPQKGGWNESADKIEQMVVETAQHPLNHNDGLGLGKSFHNGVQPAPGNYESEKGYCFAEQWKRALEVDPELIFITQWNEWIAMRFLADKPMQIAGKQLQKGDSYFVDLFSMEFNRDIEPMKGGYLDNYYYQMVDGIRRFKGTRKPAAPSPAKTIDLKDFSTWSDVKPEYRDDIGDTYHRDHPGYGDLHYTNTTGRNDFKIAKFTHDNDNLYFYIETVDPISPKTGTNWMTLLVQLEDSPAPSWEGWHFLVQPSSDASDSQLALYKSKGGWNWEKVGVLTYHLDKERMALSIPRNMLDIHNDINIRFKWSDNMQEHDPMDWILNGDVAPNGRFQYRYATTETTKQSNN